MIYLILVPLFVIGVIVLISRAAKWVGAGIEAVVGVVISVAALFALFVIGRYTIGRLPHSTTSAKAPAIPTATTRAPTKAEPTSAPTATTRESTDPTPIPSPRGTLPDAVPTTTVADPTSKVGYGSLWRNVCGSERSGYRMCRGSKPTAEQVAACFPSDACTPSTTSRKDLPY